MFSLAGGPGRPALRLLINHDDAEREFAYPDGAEDALCLAAAHAGWAVVSVRHDWTIVLAGDATHR